jgi:hypothetical protein
MKNTVDGLTADYTLQKMFNELEDAKETVEQIE